MKQTSFVIAIFALLLVFAQAKRHHVKSSDKQQYLKESANQDDIARQIFKGIAKSFNVELSLSNYQSITYENLQIDNLEKALNNFGAVQIDQSYLKETIKSIQDIFIKFRNAIPQTEQTDKIINSFLRVFADEQTFNSIKIKLYEDKGIDCQLYLWGALDYIIFDKYQVVGETLGRVIYLMNQYIE
ncbi:hypothetical protein TTHERM_00721730 (macronuclear) [Tetrahymena thermophila SB210]|uniref:Transmembrane protein n=1 Tax=Tetrahymena thermophila (strain SB210) TaxID=312017 RepID=Q22FY4_TETTS|nr:hypothetical protein TTHERM_00721730 [Tetrahymena thermophila SB210]EAR84242.2 hypothetical protein TTHERM_00721730 [Tetrahymena thermophila SB210]|eukprot:XP_001031905.2 hypothetical protein TTHERM_00721730 [Tetrahymena thermophila SB210]